MIEINIPGWGTLSLKYLVLDYNGTIALDGDPIDNVKEKINQLAEKLEVYIITADTHGYCAQACRGLDVKLHILTRVLGGPEKRDFVRKLGAEQVVAVGNGANDALMLKEAGLGIAVTGPEGAAVKSVMAANIAVNNILDGLELLMRPKRLIATLRE